MHKYVNIGTLCINFSMHFLWVSSLSCNHSKSAWYQRFWKVARVDSNLCFRYHSRTRCHRGELENMSMTKERTWVPAWLNRRNWSNLITWSEELSMEETIPSSLPQWSPWEQTIGTLKRSLLEPMQMNSPSHTMSTAGAIDNTIDTVTNGAVSNDRPVSFCLHMCDDG